MSDISRGCRTDDSIPPLSTAEVVVLLHALAHPVRRRILEALANGDWLPSDQVRSHVGVKADELSYHVRILLDADVVGRRKAGRQVSFALNWPILAELVELLRELIELPGRRST
ncbi:MAG: ArsR family transcriptional regulator [Pseudonocardiales bacterium]|nr:ArsR family transcriptional regulator [Pseudonocardiales bacterium]